MNQNRTNNTRRIAGIKLPARVKVDQLKSSIKRAFINTTILEIKPTSEEEATWRKYLGISPTAMANEIKCAYCGQHASHFDHFRNLTVGGYPSGYVTDIYNLVPCCNACNNSKRGENWRSWITGSTPNPPQQHLSADELAIRVKMLDCFEAWSNPIATRLKVLALVGKAEWEQAEADIDAAISHLQAARKRSDLFHQRLQQAYNEQKSQAQGPRLPLI